MAIDLHADGRVAELRARGTIDREDYQRVVPELEELIEEHDTIRMLVLLEDLDQWTPGAAWEDAKFDANHFSDVERLAVVGDRRWYEAATVLFKPFTRAEVRYFDADDDATARAWIHEGVADLRAAGLVPPPV